MKRIAICCDGTWNSPDQNENGVTSPTNVVKLAAAVKLHSDNGIAQKMYYDSGVGAQGWIGKRAWEGATGSGIGRNIKEAYTYLINNYEPGDELFFFGFSRGAFTVRSLAGLIRNCGLLRKDAIDQVDRAYTIYKSRAGVDKPSSNESILFRRTYAVEELTKIKFIGVWDTVGALGNPLLLKGITTERNSFHDYDLSFSVQHAFHALAIDEKRRYFCPALWQQKPENRGTQVMQQVWFAGVHSNVGGGYPATGLSDIALEWMMEKADACGLQFAAIAPPLNKQPLQHREETWKGAYKLLPRLYRSIDKPEGVTRAGAIPITAESLHESVLQRYRDSDYQPPNLVDYFDRNPEMLPDEDD
jgi:uncharacterized protein (DUF2235 family)